LKNIRAISRWRGKFASASIPSKRVLLRLKEICDLAWLRDVPRK
jgi:hypothetical protein